MLPFRINKSEGFSILDPNMDANLTDAKQHMDRKTLAFVEIILKMMSEYIKMVRGELCGKIHGRRSKKLTQNYL